MQRFAESSSWVRPTTDDYLAASELAELPSSADVLDQDEQAKRFDLFVLRTQLGALVGDPGAPAARRRIQAIANALASQRGIPRIDVNIAMIAAVATEEWWADVTVPMLEMMRIRMRELVFLVDSRDRAIVYTDFADEGSSTPVEIALVAPAVDRARFREKAYAFLREHEDDVAIFKLRHGHPLTPLDLSQLERVMLELGDFTPADISRIVAESSGLGMFVRSLVGMDRAAATSALSSFTARTTLTGNQLAFVNLVVTS